VVQASVHGADNSALLDAVRAHPDRLRAIAAVTEDVTDRELVELNAAGVRGIRVTWWIAAACRFVHLMRWPIWRIAFAT